MTYIEDGRRVKIDCEFHFDPLGVYIFTGDDWRWEGGPTLPDEEKRRIEDNLVEYHANRGYEVTVRS